MYSYLPDLINLLYFLFILQSSYENYGLQIKVKFRNDGDLQVLDSHTQSGGERALTTAVYLLSLQAITSVPFRCVDEINQVTLTIIQ